MPQLIVLDDAEDELTEAEEWYESKRKGLGSEFVPAINEALNRIVAHPGSALLHSLPAESSGVRTFQVRRFPYSVVYLNERDTIWVVAFAHQRRHPGYWQDRSENG